MKAIRVTGLSAAPGAGGGEPRLELGEADKPQRRTGAEVLVRVLCVGLDGTDREIISEKYGVPPEGDTTLIIGHESLGVVEEADPATGLKPGDAVCALVRRPCTVPACVACRNGQQDFCESGAYVERGIKGAHGFLSEYYVEEARYLVRVPAEALPYGVMTEPQSIVEKVWSEVQRVQQRLVWQPKTAVVLGSGPLGLLAALTCRCLGLETIVWSKAPADSAGAQLVRECGGVYKEAEDAPAAAAGAEAGAAVSPLSAFLAAQGKRADLIFECTGFSPLAFDAMEALAPNGVLALLGVTPGSRSIRISADLLNRELVLENKLILGSVNASRRDFETGLYRLQQMEERFPGVLGKLVTERLRMEDVPQLDFAKLGIKAVVDVVPQEQWVQLVRAEGAGAEAEITYSFTV
ncbi:threonine dehydrogenase-like Zn-dependent dehydrogenase [Paenibacillus mucilaginosus]|uniref:glucose 1-dehydrogenase n=1 Tax=Paenibacillus mucilaginosus TaxID=61624 RepID=UPI003D1DB8C1